MRSESESGKPKKYIKRLTYGLVLGFSLFGMILTAAFFAVKFHVTDDPGAVDYNDRYFQEIKDKYGKSEATDTTSFNHREATLFQRVLILNKYYPENSLYILNAYLKSRDLVQAEKMLDAVNLYLKDNDDYQKESNQVNSQDVTFKQRKKGSAIEWMNISEWNDFKLAVAKDKALIDSAAQVTDVESRLIVAVLVGEQIRLFNSEREAYKKWIGPLKILSVESTFSLGVTGIKVPTAQFIEKNLKDSTSAFYLGRKYEKLLDFETNNPEQERFKRLTSYQNHYYSYLYAALNIKMMKMQWERAGFPIGDRPEILATLFNIGFEASQPKINPIVGGSRVMIHRQPYTFGAIAFDFYYSGELYDLFPFMPSRFDWKK